MIFSNSVQKAFSLALSLKAGETRGNSDVVPTTAQVNPFLLGDATRKNALFPSSAVQGEISGGAKQRDTRQVGPKQDCQLFSGVQSKISSLSRAVNLGPEKKLPEGLLISKLQAPCRSWGLARALGRLSRLEIFLSIWRRTTISFMNSNN